MSFFNLGKNVMHLYRIQYILEITFKDGLFFNTKPNFRSVEFFLHLGHKSSLYRMLIQYFIIFHHLQYMVFKI